MKKGEKKKVISIVDKNAFLSKIYLNVYCVEVEDCTYFGKMNLNDLHESIPLEIEFSDETISFWWWARWRMDTKQIGEKMRNYLFGFTSGFFSDADVYVDEDSVNDGKMTLLVTF